MNPVYVEPPFPVTIVEPGDHTVLFEGLFRKNRIQRIMEEPIFIRRTDDGTAIVPMAEYLRLLKVESDFNNYLANAERVIIESGLFHRTVVNPNDAIKDVIYIKDKAEKELRELKQKKVPMFNRPGKKVYNL